MMKRFLSFFRKADTQKEEVKPMNIRPEIQKLLDNVANHPEEWTEATAYNRWGNYYQYKNNARNIILQYTFSNNRRVMINDTFTHIDHLYLVEPTGNLPFTEDEDIMFDLIWQGHKKRREEETQRLQLIQLEKRLA